MRDKIIVFFVVAALCMQGVFAISTNMKDSYSPKETVIVTLAGDIINPIQPAMIEFRRGHVLVPFDYELKKIENKYYIWFITPREANNYTLAIKDITTTVSGKPAVVTYEKNFSVAGNLSDYFVRPGVISTDKDIEVTAVLNGDYEKPVFVKFIDSSNVTLKPGENLLKFSVEEIENSSLFEMIIGKYTIPVYVIVNEPTKRPSANITVIIEGVNISLAETDTENLSVISQEALDAERLKHSCYDFPGSICLAKQRCNGDTVVSADGPCCVNGVCLTVESESSSKAWIGYLLGFIVIIGGVFIWLRYKKVKAEKNPLEKKVQAIEKRAH